jgi:hypothetical protein
MPLFTFFQDHNFTLLWLDKLTQDLTLIEEKINDWNSWQFKDYNSCFLRESEVQYRFLLKAILLWIKSSPKVMKFEKISESVWKTNFRWNVFLFHMSPRAAPKHIGGFKSIFFQIINSEWSYTWNEKQKIKIFQFHFFIYHFHLRKKFWIWKKTKKRKEKRERS